MVYGIPRERVAVLSCLLVRPGLSERRQRETIVLSAYGQAAPTPSAQAGALHLQPTHSASRPSASRVARGS